MNKLLITRVDGRILTVLTEDSRAVQMEYEEEESSLLGNIYIGKVKNIVKNINSAFVEIGKGQMSYYSLSDNKTHHFAVSQERKDLREGDEILVQVARDAVKTKDPVVTANLSFTGHLCVLTAGKNQISFSSKIRDQEWKDQMRTLLEPEKEDEFGIIVRTNAAEAEPEVVIEELRQLKAQYHQILENGAHRTCYSKLYEAYPSYINRIRDTYVTSMEEIVTDDKEIYEQLKQYLHENQPENEGRLRFYEDSMLSLTKLYQIEKSMEEALSTHVWLKSGGYLVIEPTEAMTVIDVNTGKYTGKKNKRDTILKINLEAAAEISHQMRLRNLSGIILVDFIDMEEKEDQELLMKTLSVQCAKDPVKTTVVDMTRLNLVEITRKKIRRPLYEQVHIGKRR